MGPRDDSRRAPGSLPAGAFGRALKKAACATERNFCNGCLLRANCAYLYIFERGPENDSPHPFVLVPPLTDRSLYSPGELLDWELVLIGNGIDALAYFIYAFSEMGRNGLGAGKGRYRLSRVDSLRPGASEPVFSEASRTLRDPSPAVTADELLRARSDVFKEPAGSQPSAVSRQRLTIDFLTPTRLKHDNRLTDEPQFHIVIRRLLQRVDDLLKFHHGFRLDLDFPGLVGQAEQVRLIDNKTHWADWERYSNRQETRMKLGGLLGQATYEGQITPFLPFLLLGEWTHLGKNTSFGLGRYRVVTEKECKTQ
jgi:hypothetical protein